MAVFVLYGELSKAGKNIENKNMVDKHILI